MAKDTDQPVQWERAVVTHADCPPDHAPGYGLTLRLEYPDGTVRYVAVAVNGMTARFEEEPTR